MDDESLVQFKLVLPEGLKGRVEEAAKRNRRSLSKEIVATLEVHYRGDGEHRTSADELFQTFASLFEQKLIEKMIEVGWTPPAQPPKNDFSTE